MMVEGKCTRQYQQTAPYVLPPSDSRTKVPRVSTRWRHVLRKARQIGDSDRICRKRLFRETQIGFSSILECRGTMYIRSPTRDIALISVFSLYTQDVTEIEKLHYKLPKPYKINQISKKMAPTISRHTSRPIGHTSQHSLYCNDNINLDFIKILL